MGGGELAPMVTGGGLTEWRSGGNIVEPGLRRSITSSTECARSPGGQGRQTPAVFS
jgi:hypothetical protein